jgi:glycosidase
MYVILDWVANHTAWDHPWVLQHPDWYTHDANGNIVPPVPDWSDVADLNYDNTELRKEMIRAMEYWVRDCGIDGYRCDVAMNVPTEFWNDARAALDAIKPVFMLAEGIRYVIQLGINGHNERCSERRKIALCFR